MEDDLENRPVSREAIYWAYFFILGREPEEKRTIEGGIKYHKTLGGLRDNLLSSTEGMAKILSKIVPQLDDPIISYNSKRGFSINLDLRDLGVSLPIFLFDEFEPHVESKILDLLDKDKIFLDVGANVGWFSVIAGLYIKNMNGRGKVLCFEANRRLASLLGGSVRDNGLDEYIEVHSLAVSDTLSYLSFCCEEVGNIGGGRVIQKGKNEELSIVPSIDLDSLLSGRKHSVGLIKMDIEGHELNALRGAKKLITEDRPCIIFEVSSHAVKKTDHVCSFFDQLGYKIFAHNQMKEPLTIGEIKNLASSRGYFDFIALPENKKVR